jgi:hypothetical protein
MMGDDGSVESSWRGKNVLFFFSDYYNDRHRA